MTAVALLLCALAGGGEVPDDPEPPVLEDTGAPPPWGPGPQPWVSPLELEGLVAYHRYQRMAHVGAPLFLTGAALGGWAVWAFEVGRINVDQETFALAGAAAVGGVGAGFLTFGSYNAVSRLYDGKPPALGTVAGYTGYGLLAASSVLLVAGAIGFFFLPQLLLISAVGLPVAAASGVPGLIQTAVNPILRRRWEREHRVVRLSPLVDPRARPLSGLALHTSF